MLYVVATPIGNLDDLSPRAAAVLERVRWIACEDTRRTRKLLRHFTIRTPLVSYHEHNERQRAPILIRKLLDGQSGALVSDAGTPLVSDPGYRLVRLCRESSVEVVPLPGPSAALAALSVSGLPCDSFHFAGFPPRKPGQLRHWIEDLSALSSTLILYLSPHRLEPTLRAVAEVWGGRECLAAREMTKLHETYRFGPLSEVAEELIAAPARGEYTLVVAGASGVPEGPAVDLGAYVSGLVQVRGMTLKEAIRAAAVQLDVPRNRVYQAVQTARRGDDSPREMSGEENVEIQEGKKSGPK